MTHTRKRPSAAFWATFAVVAVLVGYPLSIGPACWLENRLIAHDIIAGEMVYGATADIFAPVLWARDRGPRPLKAAYWWYLGLWVEVHPENIS